MAFAIRNRRRQDAAVDAAGPTTEAGGPTTQAGPTTEAGGARTQATAVEPAASTGAPPGRARVAAGRTAWAAGSMLTAIARLVRLVTGLVALVLVIAIVLHLVSANGSNSVVNALNDAGRWLAGPFRGAFAIHGHPKGTLALNWGIATVVYLIVGGVIASLIARSAPTGISPAAARARRHRGVPPAAPVA